MTELAEKAPLTDVKWVLAVAGQEGQIVVEAATVEDRWAGGGSVHSAGDVMLTYFLDADGKIVFRAPALSIAYLRRSDDPG